MINTKTYEEIKNSLVNRILNDYIYYKDGLNKFHNEIAHGYSRYCSGNRSPISPKDQHYMLQENWGNLKNS